MIMMGEGAEMSYGEYYDNSWSMIPPDYIPPEEDYSRYNSYP